jgi:hypothetical protein
MQFILAKKEAIHRTSERGETEKMELMDSLFKQSALAAAATRLGKAVAKAEGSRLLAARRNGLLEASQVKLDEAREALRAGEITAGDSAGKDMPVFEPLRKAVRKFEDEVRLRTEARARQDEIAREDRTEMADAALAHRVEQHKDALADLRDKIVAAFEANQKVIAFQGGDDDQHAVDFITAEFTQNFEKLVERYISPIPPVTASSRINALHDIPVLSR